MSYHSVESSRGTTIFLEGMGGIAGGAGLPPLAAAALLAALSWSCGSDLACEPGTRCGGGLVCLRGVCAPCRGPVDDPICGAPAELCIEGKCQPGCREDIDCPLAPKLFCDTAVHQCVDCSAKGDALCGEGKICVAGQCLSGNCHSSPDCPQGKVCRDHYCGTCEDIVDDGLCQERGPLLCVDAECAQIECRKKEDCPAAEVCIDHQCTVCDDAQGGDDLCSEDGVSRLCVNTVCVPGECRVSDDCPNELPVCDGFRCRLCDRAGGDDERAICLEGDVCDDFTGGDSAGWCIEGCRVHSDCLYLSRPKCDFATHACGPCDSATDNTTPGALEELCGSPGFFCGDSGSEAGRCVKGCRTHDDCFDMTLPKCDSRPGHHTCGPCSPTTDNTLAEREAVCGGLEFVCNSAGACVEGCLTNAECPSLQYPRCATTANTCAPCRPGVDADSEVCAKEAAAGSPYICALRQDSASEGECVPGECRNNAMCSARYPGNPAKANCDPVTHLCGPCLVDANCVAGKVCIQGSCLTGDCHADSDCGSGKLCQSYACAACRDPEDDLRCDSRYRPGGAATVICKSGGCAVGCRDRSDCTAGQVCRQSACAPCLSSIECGGGQVCDSGACVVGDCLPAAASFDPMCTSAAKADCKESGASKNFCGPCTEDTAGDALCAAKFAGTICLSGECKVGCRTSAQCTGGKYCNATTRQCEPCSSDANCGAGKICWAAQRKCVSGECDADSDCAVRYADGTKPFCDLSTFICRPCTYVAPRSAADSRCGATKICLDSGVCRPGCRTNAECVSPNVCRSTTLDCGPCTGDQDCTGGKHCKTTVSPARCVECTQNIHCATQNCNTATNTCQGCSDSAQCDADEVCDTVAHECVACIVDGDCQSPDKRCVDRECWECKTTPTVRADCTEDPFYPICVDYSGSGGGYCLPCIDDGECAPDKCVYGECVECATNADCAPKVCKSRSCVSCTSTADCTLGMKCVTATTDAKKGQCVACLTNSDCNFPSQVCRADHSCGACTEDAQCSPNALCVSGTCKPGNCRTDANCTGSKVCARSAPADPTGFCTPACTVKYTFTADAPVMGPVALSADESTVYFVDDNGTLYAVRTSDGALRWRSRSTGKRGVAVGTSGYAIGVTSGPMVDAQGIYVGGADGKLYRFDASGSNADNPILFFDTQYAGVTGGRYSLENTTPVIVNTSTPPLVYVAMASGTLLALHRDNVNATTGGAILQWKRQTAWPYPAIYSIVAQRNGTVFMMASDDSNDNSILAAYDKAGAQLWSKAASSKSASFARGGGMAIATLSAKDVIWTGSNFAGTFFKYDAAGGALLTRADIVCPVAPAEHRHAHTSPAVDAAGNLYFAHECTPGKLVAYTSEPSFLWGFNLANNYTASSPAVGANGTVFLTSGITDGQSPKKSRFHAVADGQEVCGFDVTGTRWSNSSPVIDQQGVVYFGGGDGKLYAVLSRSRNGQSAGGWPRFHRNAQSTGSQQ